MSEARVKVSLNDIGTIEMEGSEAFVSAELEKFRESIRAGMVDRSEEHPAPVAAAPVAETPVVENPVAEDPVAENPVAENPVPVDTLDDIFAATDTGVRILTE